MNICLRESKILISINKIVQIFIGLNPTLLLTKKLTNANCKIDKQTDGKVT